jgi:hypothetical protein
MPHMRMWLMETDRYGPTDRKFCVDDPLHVPRIGEFVDSDEAGGWVTHVQYSYLTPSREFYLVVNVYLGDKNDTYPPRG